MSGELGETTRLEGHPAHKAPIEVCRGSAPCAAQVRQAALAFDGQVSVRLNAITPVLLSSQDSQAE
jgi:hypothetical protein